MKAAFLDRDGVIINNSQHYYIYKEGDVEFVDGIFENLTRLQLKGYTLFVVSNQGGISKGEYTQNDVDQVHQFIQQELAKHQLEIKEFVFCPHHDSLEICLCRKPSPLMIERLIAKYQINASESFLIGDSRRDIEAAESAGVSGYLIPSNQNMQPILDRVLNS